MTQSPEITSMIDMFKTRKHLANAIGAKQQTVHRWARCGRIPANWHAHVIRAAQNEGLKYVTAEWMVAKHDRAAK